MTPAVSRHNIRRNVSFIFDLHFAMEADAHWTVICVIKAANKPSVARRSGRLPPAAVIYFPECHHQPARYVVFHPGVCRLQSVFTEPRLKFTREWIFIALSGHKKFRMRPAATAIAHDRLSRYFSRVS